jgi:hypothetical protein
MEVKKSIAVLPSSVQQLVDPTYADQTDKGRPTHAHILDLPNELLTETLKHVPVDDARHVGLACKVLHDASAKAGELVYKKRYGCLLAPRRPLPADWGAIAREVEALSSTHSPGCVSQMSLQDEMSARSGQFAGHVVNPQADESFLPLNQLYGAKPPLRKAAQRLMGELIRCDKSTNKRLWHEAVAAMLMAQQRTQEAGVHYAIVAQDAAVPPRTALIAARFGWPHAHVALPPLQTLSQSMRQQAFLGAAAAGDVRLMQALATHGVDIGHIHIAAESAVSASILAAQNGRLEALQFLHESINTLSPESAPGAPEPMDRQHFVNAPLLAAAISGHVHCIDYLLTVGAVRNPEIVEDAFREAMANGTLATVQALVGRYPVLKNDFIYGQDSGLRLASLFDAASSQAVSENIEADKIAILNFLVETCGLSASACYEDEDGVDDLVAMALTESNLQELAQRVIELSDRFAV